jgi:NAD(P)-dependent dehydrogenase (short-subunit alcohol dehydrogenase family)
MNARRRYVLIGGSRGIGLACAKHLSEQGCDLICVSRTRSPYGQWLMADVRQRDSINRIRAAIGEGALDGLLYLGGIWDAKAFTETYEFAESTAEDIAAVLEVNLLAPVLLTQALLPNLRRQTGAKVIFMGALSGLEQSAGREVANSASKYGLRGTAQALRQTLRRDRIGVTVINPGNVATEEVLADLARNASTQETAIPLEDLLKAVDFVLATSEWTTVSEINLHQNVT